MTVTVLYPEDRQVPDLALEQEVFGRGAHRPRRQAEIRRTRPE